MAATASIIGKDRFEAPFRVGPHEVPGRALLAPMSGLTDVAMRRIARRFGAGLVVTEMVAAEAYADGDAANRLKAEDCGLGLHVVQIAGRDPAAMARGARVARDAGAAVIDLNMGCPAKKVINGYAGSHLMRDLPLAAAIIRATVAAVDVPVTLKMRLGWDSLSLNAAELGRVAEAEGVAMLCVHGRTRSQFYDGVADWGAIRAVREAVSIPLVANGDCSGLDDAREMLRASGADAVMIGRAAVGRPWLVGAAARGLAGGPAREPSAEARREAACEHYDELLRLFGREQGVRHARKHLAAYAQWSGSPRAVELRADLVKADDPREVMRLLKETFDPSFQAEAA
ncbi:tRNA dihydrouridine synthase DusB [Methylocella sp.]|uniref:tRNA dihydrouridine synthase DusB n=1 Tax=Methylocella sp. TaxID=1978226 RepID=UPI0037850369